MKLKEASFAGMATDEVTELEQWNRILSREAAEEGIVLLENRGGLPLNRALPVALFGNGAAATRTSGTGSGDVDVRRSVSVYEGMKLTGFQLTSEAWLQEYEKELQKEKLLWRDKLLKLAGGAASERFFDVHAENPFRCPEGREIREEDIGEAAAAVYVISRTQGEGSDRRPEKGDYYLTDRELSDLKYLGERVGHVILVLNVGGVISLEEIDRIDGIKAVVLLSYAGEEGGNALARILSGAATPGGHLTATWARAYSDYPCAESFGSVGDTPLVQCYREGIYVGYRYFDSFDLVPRYSFGHGLSYTTFSYQLETPKSQGETLELSVTVTNTGSRFSGRETILFFAMCPQEKQAKELKRLIGFGKTRLLSPGEEDTITVTVPAKALASFSEEKHSFIVERGDYVILAGNSGAEEQLLVQGVVRVPEEVVLEQVAPLMPPKVPFLPLEPDQGFILCRREEFCKKWEMLKRAAADGRSDILASCAHKAETVSGAPGRIRRLSETLYLPAGEESFRYREDPIDRMAKDIAEGLELPDLLPLLMGEPQGESAAVGAQGQRVPGSAGETSGALQELLHIPGVVMADGPAGLRLRSRYHRSKKDQSVENVGFAGTLEGGLFLEEPEHPEEFDTYYQYTTCWPSGTCLAQSFDTRLMEKLGQAVGREMESFQVTLWLAPGLNLHRNPLCGRNFEYYGEDPLLSGAMAAAVTRGVQCIPGVGTTIKHFACNNQEEERMHMDAEVSERALRELYLRSFEIAVKEAQPMCVMTSYNKINGLHTANHGDLLNGVLRREWGFKGLVMSDWIITVVPEGADAALCPGAGNDLIMPGTGSDRTALERGLSEGTLSEEAVRSAAEHILSIVLRSNGYEDARSYYSRFL